MIKKFNNLIVLLLLSISLIGCAYKKVHVADDLTVKSKAARLNAIAANLATDGVMIDQDGQTVAFILPAKQLFVPNSANLKNSAYATLDLVADYLRYYDISMASVVGYTAESKNEIITYARAHKVVQYLWSSKVGVSFMYADAEGMVLVKKNNRVLTDSVIVSFSKEG